MKKVKSIYVSIIVWFTQHSVSDFTVRNGLFGYISNHK